jgi:hypothetical protein
MVDSGGRRWLWNAELSTHLRGVGSKVLDGGRFAGARETGHVRPRALKLPENAVPAAWIAAAGVPRCGYDRCPDNLIHIGAGVSTRQRWVLASVLGVVAALAVAGAIAAGTNPRHYVHLMPYGRPGVVVTVLVVASLLLGAAAWLVLRNRIARGIAAGATVVLALAMCATGAQFTAAADAFGADPRSVTVLGIAPGGRFELVRLEYSSIGLGADIVRVRSREGLRSREAGQNLACFVVPFDHDATPDRTFATARFIGGTTVEVTTADGTAWTTAFDPHTLLAAQTLSYCRG